MLDNDKGPMMRASDEAMRVLLDALAVEHGQATADDMKVQFDCIIRQRRAEAARRKRDREAAELLPLGRHVAAERLGVAESTVYKMFHRYLRNRSTVTDVA